MFKEKYPFAINTLAMHYGFSILRKSIAYDPSRINYTHRLQFIQNCTNFLWTSSSQDEQVFEEYYFNLVHEPIKNDPEYKKIGVLHEPKQSQAIHFFEPYQTKGRLMAIAMPPSIDKEAPDRISTVQSLEIGKTIALQMLIMACSMPKESLH